MNNDDIDEDDMVKINLYMTTNFFREKLYVGIAKPYFY